MSDELSFQGDGSDRLPPQNIEAEEAILGGILLDPEAIARVSDRLVPDAFYVSAHREIYQVALKLYAQSKPTDLLSVTSWLTDCDLLAKVGGRSKLASLVDRTVSAVNIDALATLVMDKFLRRKLIKAGNEIVHLGYETQMELPKVLDKAEQKVFGIAQERPQSGLVHIADTLIDAFENIEERHQGVVLPGIPGGFYDLDAMTSGFQRSDLVIIAGRPSMGKCLHENSEIVVSDGSILTIKEIYQRRRAELLTLNNNWKFDLTQPSAFIDDGIKPTFRVTTALGRCIETTITHPYLTIKGWQQLEQLEVGDKIAIPRRIDIFGKETIRECQVKLLAYLIGDGCLTDTTPEFTNINPKIQQDFIQGVKDFAPQMDVRIESCHNRSPILYAKLSQGKQNPLKQWLDELGLWGKKSGEKTIPDIIFKLERLQLALFLNRLFATDGWASLLSSSQVQLGYATVSEKLARQVQHLLLRFGIIAALKKRFVKYQNTRRLAYQIDITDALSIKTFIAEICIFGKEEALDKINNFLAQKRYQTNRNQKINWIQAPSFRHGINPKSKIQNLKLNDLIPIEIWPQLAVAKGQESWHNLAQRAGIKGYTNIHSHIAPDTGLGTQSAPRLRVPASPRHPVGKRALSRQRLGQLANTLENLPLQQLATSDIYWDKIVAIEPTGCHQVYDLTIPNTHNFVANDVCVHNTAFCLNLAHNIASLYKLPVAMFSLEMSKEQLVQRLLASEAGIESGYLRSGRISQSQWEPLSRAIGMLSEMPIYIDDTPNITVTEMRSQARRLQAEVGTDLGLVIIDYLQLMEGAGDNRVQELSRITRSIKGLARELNAPVIALSQLSRGVEARNNKRPMLSDLRESGCLTGDSLVTLADTGVQVPIRELVGKSGFAVWALNETTMKLEKAIVSNAFSTGIKPIFTLTTRLGRTIKATGNHKFFTIHGWRRLDELNPKQHLCLPRHLPNPGKQTMTYAEVAFCGSTLDKANLSRERTSKVAEVVQSKEIFKLSNSDVYWDEIVSIECSSTEEVFDLTVPKLHNFVANNIIVHNSIEQDADLVIMLYRDDYYNSDSPDRGIAEVIIAKHRNGPTGTVKLLFDPQYTKFKNLARPN